MSRSAFLKSKKKSKVPGKLPESSYLENLLSKQTESVQKKKNAFQIGIGTILCIAFGFIPRIMSIFIPYGKRIAFKVWVSIWNMGIIFQFWLLLNRPAPGIDQYINFFIFLLSLQFLIFLYYNWKILVKPIDYTNSSEKSFIGYCLAIDFIITVSKLVFVIVPSLMHFSSHLRT